MRARRRVGLIAAAALIAVVATGCTSGAPQPKATAATSSADGALAKEIRASAEKEFSNRHLESLLAQVRVNGKVVSTIALGDAMTGVPATTDGHFRNGAVAITYVAATMLRMQELGMIDIDKPIATWTPDLPNATTTTPRMLATMTAGYPDHVGNADFLAATTADPYRNWTSDELLAFGKAIPHPFAPGANWDYSHSGYVALGVVLSKAGHAPLASLISKYVLKPLRLTGTDASQTATIPAPVIHGFTGERGVFEDSTYWNPSWTLPEGAVETTTISDMARSFDDILTTNTVLDAKSRKLMTSDRLLGFGSPLEGCRTCHTLTPAFNYGVGVFLKGDWLMQNPLFGGYASAVATLPKAKNGGKSVTIAVAVSPSIDNASWINGGPNWGEELVDALATQLAPTATAPVFHGADALPAG